MELYKGLHRIRLELGSARDAAISLLWRARPADAYSEVERKYLINSNKIFGSNVVYRDQNKVIYRELEPSIDYRTYYYQRRPAYNFTTNNVYNIEWNGKVRLPAAGTYTFKLHTLYDAEITIDGAVVYRQEKGVEHITPVRLSGGIKEYRITSPYKYIANLWDPGSTVRFMYKDSGHREYMPVTYDMLIP
jgi:hypothetical protein